MDNLLIVAASSDLSKSYIDHIQNDLINIDAIVREPNKLKNKENFENIYTLDLNDLNKLSKFKLTKKYSQIIFFQGIDIIKPFHLYNYDDIIKSFNINLLSVILLLKSIISNKNILNFSSIVIITSISGITKGSPGHSLYSSSKAGLLGLIKSLSIELSKRKVRINCISPGLIKTESLFQKNKKNLSDSQLKDYKKKYPLGIGKVDSLNDMIKFLLNKSSYWITGQNFIVDGGNSNV